MNWRGLLILGIGSLTFSACAAIGGGSSVVVQSIDSEEELRLVTLLPKDGIPSIDNPRFYSAADADREYEPDEQIIGVEFDGDARAYPIGLLSSHEVVNDKVGGRAIAVTW